MIQREAIGSVRRKAQAAGVVTALVMLTGQLNARAQTPSEGTPADDAGKNKPALHIGTFDIQAAFDAHPAQKELLTASEAAQTQLQQAQQQGDQQKMQQIQQQFEQTRNQVVEKFHEQVAASMPAVAKATGVKLVASEVVYTAADVQTRNITEELIKSFDKKAESGESEKPAEGKVALHVGIYDPQEAFDAHPAQKELLTAAESAQTQMQEAQQQGDQQKMQQIQQQFEQSRARTIEKFQQDVEKTMPTAAQAAGVQVAAVEIVYKANDVQTRNITPELIKAFN